MFRSRLTIQKHKQPRSNAEPSASTSIPPNMQTSNARHEKSYHFSSFSSQHREPIQPSCLPAYRPSLLSTARHDSSFPSFSTHIQSKQPPDLLASKRVFSEHSFNNNSTSTSASTFSNNSNSTSTSTSNSSHLDNEVCELDEDEAKLLTHVDIIDEQGNLLRTKKMSTKDVCRLNAGERVLVQVNEFDQPIRAGAALCTRYMTLLLKQPNLCPPDVTGWIELKVRSGVRLMAELRRKFSLPYGDNVDRVIFLIFDDKFRTLKHQLKLRLFKLAAEKLKEANNNGDDGVKDRKYNEEELLQGLDLIETPSNFKDDQWEYYKNHLRTTKSKKLSQNGKHARAQQIHHRVTGSTSHARKKDEFNLKNKRQPYEVESFNILYQRKNGSYAEDHSEKLMDRAREEVDKRVLVLKNNSEFVGPEARREIETEVMRDLIGSDNPGRAPCYGAGVRKSQLTNLSHGLKRLRGDNLRNDMLLGKVECQSKQIESQNRQIESQNKQIEAQNKHIEAQNKQISVQNNQIRTMQETINVIRSDLQLFQTTFRGMYGTTPPAARDPFFTEDAYFPRPAAARDTFFSEDAYFPTPADSPDRNFDNSVSTTPKTNISVSSLEISCEPDPVQSNRRH